MAQPPYYTDLQRMGHMELRDGPLWLEELVESLTEQPALVAVSGALMTRRWASISAFLEALAERLPNRLVWAIDEADLAFGPHAAYPLRQFLSEVLANPGNVFNRKVTVVLALALEGLEVDWSEDGKHPMLGRTVIRLCDFSREEVDALQRQHGGPLSSPESLGRFIDLFGSQQYLVQVGLDLLTERGLTLEALERGEGQTVEPLREHLLTQLLLVMASERKFSGIQKALRGEVLEEDAFHSLCTQGVLSGNWPTNVRFRCGIYERFFRQQVAEG